MRCLIIFVLVLAMVLTSLYFGINIYIQGRTEQIILKRITKILGPASNYEIEVNGSTFDFIQRKIPSIRIKGINIKPRRSPNIDLLNISIKNIKITDPKMKNIEIGKTEFQATLSTTSVNSYLMKNNPQLDDLKISLLPVLPGKFSAWATISTPDHTSLLHAEGTVRIVNNSLVIFSADKVTSKSGRDMQFLAPMLEERLNPIFDSTKWNTSAKLTSIDIGDGKIVVEGEVDFYTMK